MINYLIRVTCVFIYGLITREKLDADRFIRYDFIINDLGSLTIHVNKKIFSLSSKQCQTMIKYGNYLHKSRVIVFLFSDSNLVQSVIYYRAVSVVSFWQKLPDLRSWVLIKRHSKNPYLNAFV